MRNREIVKSYVDLLRQYVEAPDEAILSKVSLLGQQAATSDVFPEELGEMQKAALDALVASEPDAKLIDVSEAVSVPLVEFLIAYGLESRVKVAERESLSQTATEREKLYSQMFLGNQALQLLIDPSDGTIVDANPTAQAFYVSSLAELRGMSLSDIWADEDQTIDEMLQEASQDGHTHFTSRHQCGNGSLPEVEVYSSNVTVNGQQLLYWIIHDITDRRKSEAAIRHMAQHDALTGLPNRNLFNTILKQALSNAERIDRQVAVLYIDLDEFKHVNDSLGHRVGDLLLKSVASRLTQCARDTDAVAHMGGDEFAIVATNLERGDAVTALATRILASLNETLDFDGQRVTTGASIGITLFPSDSRDAEQLLKNADMALYRAKARGRNRYQYYDKDLHAEDKARKTLERDLYRGLERDEFVVHYQPKIDLSSGHVVGAEALVRWHHPQRGLVPPDMFIPMAEEVGMIRQLGQWVLGAACAQTAHWHREGFSKLRIAVNLSPRQFQDRTLAGSVNRILGESGLDPSDLDLEVTETHLAEDFDAAIEIISEFRAIGISVSIDDFGTGFSSLGQLKHIPVDNLKIDRTFVRDMVTDLSDAAMVEVIIKLGHSLDLRVIAEGAETAEQVSHLRRLGCDEVQGYFYSRPLPPEEFAQWLELHEKKCLEMA